MTDHAREAAKNIYEGACCLKCPDPAGGDICDDCKEETESQLHEIGARVQRAIDAATAEDKARIKELEEEKRLMQFMVGNGLGPEDMEDTQ